MEAVYEFARQNRVDQLKDLLASKVNPDEWRAYDGSTALHVSARNGHESVVSLLLQAHASPLARTEDGSTPLLCAACHGSASLVKMLMDAKSELDAVNMDGTTPLIVAAYYGHSDVVAALVSGGADTNIRDEWGTALDNAKRMQRHQTVEYLSSVDPNSVGTAVRSESQCANISQNSRTESRQPTSKL